MAHTEKKHPETACNRGDCGVCQLGVWRRRKSRRIRRAAKIELAKRVWEEME